MKDFDQMIRKGVEASIERSVESHVEYAITQVLREDEIRLMIRNLVIQKLTDVFGELK